MTGEVRRLDYCDQGLTDDPDGDFVLYSDYAALLARIEAVAFHYGSLSHELRSFAHPYEWAIEVAERIRAAMQDKGGSL